MNDGFIAVGRAHENKGISSAARHGAQRGSQRSSRGRPQQALSLLRRSPPYGWIESPHPAATPAFAPESGQADTQAPYIRAATAHARHRPRRIRHTAAAAQDAASSGVEGSRRSISGHVSLTVRLSPEDDHAIGSITSSRPSSNRRIRVLCTDRAYKADPLLQSRLTRRTDL
jgi:hypothetical protein